jgi:arylsulfatase A-like enzyme
VASCDVYTPRGIAFLEHSPLGVGEKAALVARTYLERSGLHEKLAATYDAWRPQLGPLQVALPTWSRVRIGAPNSLVEAGRLIDDLSRAEPGQAFFAHLIAPHEPFVYDENCALLPRERWRSPKDDDFKTRTADNRTELYDRYAAQVRCTMRIVGEIVDAIPRPLQDDATIIVHGDHGSRLGVIPPESVRASSMSVSDYRDAYSTLFAVRSPALAAAYDPGVTSIACLFKNLVEHGWHAAGPRDGCDATPTVFIRERRRFVTRPLPAFVRPG